MSAVGNSLDVTAVGILVFGNSRYEIPAWDMDSDITDAFGQALIEYGSRGAWAEAIVTGGGLHAPELVLAEASNTLRTLEASRRISAVAAITGFELLTQLELQLHPFAPFADRIWNLRRNVTVYDAWYVAVAEELALPLATLDAPLARTESIRCQILTPA